MRALIKSFLFFPILILFLLNSAIVFALVPGHWRRRKVISHLIHFYSRLSVKVMQVKVRPESLAYRPQTNCLLVSNHLSYIDLLVIGSQMPCVFVTSREIKEAPGLGLIVTLAGCLFVERRNKESLQSEIQEVTEGLNQGLNIVIFPEATSTNGDSVLRFRKPLFSAAVSAGKPVLPVCINYLRVNGGPVTIENRDQICWYGEMTFIDHLWNFLKHHEVLVQIYLRPRLTPQAYPSSEKLAEYSHFLVDMVFQKFLSRPLIKPV